MYEVIISIAYAHNDHLWVVELWVDFLSFTSEIVMSSSFLSVFLFTISMYCFYKQQK